MFAFGLADVLVRVRRDAAELKRVRLPDAFQIERGVSSYSERAIKWRRFCLFRWSVGEG